MIAKPKEIPFKCVASRNADGSVSLTFRIDNLTVKQANEFSDEMKAPFTACLLKIVVGEEGDPHNEVVLASVKIKDDVSN